MAFVAERALIVVYSSTRGVFGLYEAVNLFSARGQFALERIEFFARLMRLEHTKVRVQRLIAARFPRLPLQRADLAFHFLNDVADSQQVRLGCLKFPERLAFLCLVLRDTGGFFEDSTTIFRAGAQNHVDSALLHHGVRCPRDPRVGEKTLNVAKAAGRFVQQILGIAVPIYASRYSHVMPLDSKLFTAIGERERDLRKADRFACLGAIKDNVRHLFTAKRFGRLLPKGP